MVFNFDNFDPNSLSDSGLANLDISNFVDINQMNNIINRANEMTKCDAECKKAKKIARLEQEYEKIKKETDDYDERLNIAEKAYFTAALGERGFREHVSKEVAEAAEVKANELESKFAFRTGDILSTIDELEQIKINGEITKELIDKIEKENKKMETEINNNETKIALNQRMAIYEYNHLTTVDFFINIFNKLMIVIFIVYLGLFIYYNLGYSKFNIAFLVLFAIATFYNYILAMFKTFYNAIIQS